MTIYKVNKPAAMTAANKQDDLRTFCKLCNSKMEPGLAIQSTWVAGLTDFIGDDPNDPNSIQTMHEGGPGKMVKCMKCQRCGYSLR